MLSRAIAALMLLILVQCSFAQNSWVQRYSGVEDSPFNEIGMPGTLFVETFEDGEFNVPNAMLIPSQEMLGTDFAIVSDPSVSTANSVGEDTGDPDSGVFLLGSPQSCAVSFPPLCPADANFVFGDEGELPTFAGFVWTDAVGSSDPLSGLPYAVASMTNADGELTVERVFDLPLFDPESSNADDLFFGFVDDKGIRELQFLVVSDLEGGYLAMDHFQVGQAALPGDADRSGEVDLEDYLTLSRNFGQEGDWSMGDFTFDGTVEFDDFLRLSAFFGQTVETSSFAVPEPAGFGIMPWLLLAAMIRKWAQRSGRASQR